VGEDQLVPDPVTLPTRDDPVSGAAFTADGRWLITRGHIASVTDTVSLWPLKLDELIALACRTAGRNLTMAEWKQYFAGQPYRKVCPGLD